MISWLGSATFIVTVTWWVGLFIWATLSGNLPDDVLDPMWTMAAFAASGLICGVIGTMAWNAIERSERREALQGTDVRGLTSSIGEVPFLIKPPREAMNLPDLRCPDIDDAFYVRWLAKHQKLNPMHAALVRRLLRILAAHKRLPASPTGERHGGRTLLQHSLLCGSLMHEMAQRFEYDGTVMRAGGRINLGLRDPAYKFDKHDPMCLLIGLAHDFGKIEAYKYDDDGRVIGIGREHDSTGARIVARLEECWDLPDADRFALTMAIAHYHHPVELPLAPDRRAIDDRTIALMELLVITDTVASAIENDGRRLTKDEIEKRLAAADAVDVAERSQDLFDHFVNELHNPASFNLTTNEGGRNLGWFCGVVGSNRNLLLVNEGNMLAAVARRAEVDPKLYAGDGRSLITIEILKRLHARSELITSMMVSSTKQVVQMPPESALWHVEFAKKTATGYVRQFGPVVCYVLEPDLFPDLVKKIGVSASRAELTSPVMGLGRAVLGKKRNGGAAPGQAAGSAQPNPVTAHASSPDPSQQSAALPAPPSAEAKPVASTKPQGGESPEPNAGQPPQQVAPRRSAPVADSLSVGQPMMIEPRGGPVDRAPKATRTHDRNDGKAPRRPARAERGRPEQTSGPAPVPAEEPAEEPGAPSVSPQGPQRAPSPLDGSNFGLGVDTRGTMGTTGWMAQSLAAIGPSGQVALGEQPVSAPGSAPGSGAGAPRADTVCAGQEPQLPGLEEDAGAQDDGRDAEGCASTDAMRPEDFELQAYEDQLTASLTSTEDELQDEGEVGAVREASPNDERQLSLDVHEPEAAVSVECAPAAEETSLPPATEETVSPPEPFELAARRNRPGQFEDRIDLTFEHDYFENWSMAAVNRMGNEALSRVTFANGAAMITLETEDLAKFAPEVDWLASRFCLLVHQQSGRFKGIKVVPGLVNFQIIVILDLSDRSSA